ncbi:hypothetical protein FB645_005212 [Coemansia sp. IMI 203386]|nr:hypothetical protein FB645_005212 [Coemansia sp. IMI 203386]
MSVVGSDSEVEEVVVQKITPRVVRRPQPARRRAALEVEDGSEESDDASFFMLGGQQTNKAYSSDSESEQEEPKESAQPEKQVEEDKSGYSSESSAAEQALESDEDDVTEVRVAKRARSVSLTPPPSARPLEKSRKIGRSAVRRPVEETAVVDVDDVSVMAVSDSTVDLDPSLLAAISGNDAVGGAALEKVQIEFRLVYDDNFLHNDVQATWVDKRWKRVKRTDLAKIRKRLDERTAVVVFSTDFVAHALRVFSDNFPVDVLAMDSVLMQGSSRVFPTSRLASLGNEPVHYIDVYPRSVYNRVRAEEALALQRRADEQAQMMKDMEIARELRRNAENAPVQESELEAEQSVGGIRIKIRDHEGKDTLLMVAHTTTVQSIIDSYRKMAGIAEGVRIRLEFDDESLDPKKCVSQTEIEDDDMLSVFCS